MCDVKPLDGVQVGDEAAVSQTITEAGGVRSIAATGNFGFAYVEDSCVQTTQLGRRLAPSAAGITRMQ